MAENGYSGHHRRQAYAAKKRAGFRCESCGRPDRTIGISKAGKTWMLYLQGAHRDHDVGNPNAAYLCLCPICHSAYDRAYREGLRQLNGQVQAEMSLSPLAEADLLEDHVRLRTEEEAAWQAWQGIQERGEQDVQLHRRALWCSCKRWYFEVQVARRCVARCRTGNWRSSHAFQALLTFSQGKQARYRAALVRYQQAIGSEGTSHLRTAEIAPQKEAPHAIR